MKTIAIFELANAVFIGVMLIGQLSSKDKTKAAKWLRITLLSFLIHLVADTLAYALAGPSYPFALRYAVNLIAYSMAGIDMLCFIMYCSIFISGKSSVKQIIFRIPLIAAGICTIACAVLFIAGKLIVYENGIAVAVNDIPIWLRMIEILILFYSPAVILRYRKEIGWKAVLLLIIYSLTPVMAGIAAIFIGTDYSIIMGAIDALLVASVVQAEEQREQLQTAFEKERESNRIIGALSEDYTGIDYVEITEDENADVGISYRTSDTFKKLVPNEEELGFMVKLLAFSDSAVYEPDREQFYRDTRRNVVLKALSDSDTYTLYPRLYIEGEIEYYEMKFSAIRENGIITAFVVGLRSIDEEKKKELTQKKQLEEAYNKLAATDRRNILLHQAVRASTWSYEINADDEVTAAYYDHFVEENTAVKIEDNPMSWIDALHPEDKDRVLAEFMAAINDHTCNTPYETTYRLLQPDGTYLWAKTSGRLSRNEDGTAELVGISINITEQIKKEREQQRELTRRTVLSKYFLSSYSTAYYLDLTNNEYDVLKTNGIIADMTKGDDTIENGAAFDTLVSVYIDGYVHPDDKDKVSTILSNENIRRQLETDEEINFTFRDVADHEPGIYRGTIIRGEDADHVGIGFKNITEEVRQQEEEQQQLAQALSMAESANRAKTDFLFSMSHDIRTPMNAIMGFTNMAIKHIEDKEKAIDCLEKIQKAGSMLLSLINSVLEMSRIESGHATLEKQQGDVYFSFANIENTMREMAEIKDIKLIFEFGDIRDRFVYADFSRCMRIFVNVISNAIKYTPEGGVVKVKCEQLGEAKDGIATYQYTISDNGIGMSEEYQKHIFEQFSREQTSTVSGIQGSGLGMSVVKSFVDLMGGTIEVYSKQGEGSTFTIVLPFQLQEKEEYIDPVTGDIITSLGPAIKKAEEIDYAGRRVLLVEDNELNREIAIEILEEEGLMVEDADDGTTAVEKLREKGPDYYDFILMDIQMPVMNGYEATKTIREMYPDKHVPIIALSANAFAEDKKKSLEAGMDDHVAKPINIKELFAALSKFL